MSLKPVHEKCIQKIYQAHTWSAANCWKWLSTTLTIVLTILLVFESQSMWKKTNTYWEHPLISFDKNCMIILSDASSDPFSYYFWSPFNDLNRAQSDRLVTPTLALQEKDLDGDEQIDEITVTLPNATFKVHSLTWLLFYDIRLSRRAAVQLDGVLHGKVERLTTGSGYYMTGDLKLTQRKPFPSRGRHDLTQSTPFLNDTELLFDSALFFPFELRKKSLQRNFTLISDRSIDYWDTTVHIASEFKLTFEFSVIEQELTYKTDAAELLKWFWIQTFAIFIVIRYIFNEVTAFLIENGIFGTIVKVDKVFHKSE